MAADIVPIALGLPSGDLYTLWAPSWHEDGEDWEALLGVDDELYGLPSPAALVAYVRSGERNDLSDHPAWEETTDLPAEAFDPAESHSYDLVGLPELLAAEPTEESVKDIDDCFAIARAIGELCGLTPVTTFFDTNEDIGAVAGGIDNFWGREGGRTWHRIRKAVAKQWDDVLTAIDDVMTTPSVDEDEVARAQADIDAAREEEAAEAARAEEARSAWSAQADEDPFWTAVGIDPIRIIADGTEYLTLRCYLGDKPVFLGRQGTVATGSSERALTRYLANDTDHDLARISTFEQVQLKATDGSVPYVVTDDNGYALDDLEQKIASTPSRVDAFRLELAMELFEDLIAWCKASGAAGGTTADAEALLETDARLPRLASLIIDGEDDDADGHDATANADADTDTNADAGDNAATTPASSSTAVPTTGDAGAAEDFRLLREWVISRLERH